LIKYQIPTFSETKLDIVGLDPSSQRADTHLIF